MDAPLAAFDQCPRGRECVDSSARTQRCAVQRRLGIRKLERVGEIHILDDSITERAVKHVASACSIDATYYERGRIEEFAVAPRQSAVRTKRHGRDAHLVFFLDQLQGAKRIALAGPLSWEIGAGDEIIDVRQHT